MDGFDYYSDRAEDCRKVSSISPELYEYYDVKKGLRDRDGSGVKAGITKISKVVGVKNTESGLVPCEGRLSYRGYDIGGLISRHDGSVPRFEEAAYLLLFGNLPSPAETEKFRSVLMGHMELPGSFVKDVIFRECGHDIMNTMARGVLGLSSYDDRAMDNSLENVVRQCIAIVSRLPMLAVYGYHSHNHYDNNGHLIILRPNPDMGMTENIMSMLRPDRDFTKLEVEVLDIALTLHMEHGGGNNSAFTARVVASSGSDSYSVIAAALLSLKGPKHGGANIKVMEMVDDIKAHVPDTDDKEAMAEYLAKIVDKKAFDGQGLIYGMGHAVYTLSDPRAVILKSYARKLSEEKGRQKDMRLFEAIEELSPEIIRSRRHGATSVCANVDLYSGFLYDMLGIPRELFTPMFAVARAVGWSAHRIEELITSGKIIRPKYVSIAEDREIVPSDDDGLKDKDLPGEPGNWSRSFVTHYLAVDLMDLVDEVLACDLSGGLHDGSHRRAPASDPFLDEAPFVGLEALVGAVRIVDVHIDYGYPVGDAVHDPLHAGVGVVHEPSGGPLDEIPYDLRVELGHAGHHGRHLGPASDNYRHASGRAGDDPDVARHHGVAHALDRLQRVVRKVPRGYPGGLQRLGHQAALELLGVLGGAAADQVLLEDPHGRKNREGGGRPSGAALAYDDEVVGPGEHLP